MKRVFVCVNETVVSRDDESDLLPEGLYQSRHIHTASTGPLRLFGYVRNK